VLDSDAMHDVDVGLYLRESEAATSAATVVNLSNRFTAIVGIPVDVHVLNDAADVCVSRSTGAAACLLG
jgi:phosphohistidine swiveling domain-containing protein